jgi:hypothetical protein
MAEGQRMTFEHFAETHLMHSLVRHVASALVWGAYRDGVLALAFAVADFGGVDLAGTPIELPVDLRYGVVHPAELDAAARAAWAKRLPAQPFEQLARAVYAASDAADCQDRLARLRHHVVPTARLLGLTGRGWRRGDAPQGGRYYTMLREGRGWTAEVAFAPGIYLGSPSDDATQALESIVFRASATLPIAILSDIQRDLVQLVE